MSVAIALALLAAQGSVPAVEAGYAELREARYADAIRTIEADPELGNPAQLINLAHAYAREGDTEMARQLLRTAIARDPVMLEAADGEWRDSRLLAWQALDRMDGKGTVQIRTAAR